MFSVRQKREIADAVQRILRDTEHPELPVGEIQFELRVDGAESWSWADIRNNGAVNQPSVNLWNESQDPLTTETMTAPVATYYRISDDLRRKLQNVANSTGKTCYCALINDGSLVCTDKLKRAEGYSQLWTFHPTLDSQP